MCGIAGFLSSNAAWLVQPVLQRMTDSIARRGPDDVGYWLDAQAGVALGHRRLAVVDVSPAGHQPMVSGGGRYVITFNGEIYNYPELRAEVERTGQAPDWRGHSDTEALLAGFDIWGVQATLAKCVGMFAFALWDRQDRVLTLARDRLGEKPLYYGWQGAAGGEAFLFGSELKALKAHPAFSAEIDRGALGLLMRHGYIPAPHSIYRGIAKLPPACLLTLSAARRTPVITKYWSAQAAVEDGLARPFTGSPEQAVDALEALLEDAVQKQMMADVPLGAFLSGGVDSSAVVAAMQAVARKQGGAPVKTYTIGFDEAAYNEADHAKAVAQHLKTDHTELYVSPQRALSVIPMLPKLYCEPFADSSQIPTFLVSEMAREHVTVALSGDAGDELFGGYNRYLLGQQLWGKLRPLPMGMRRAAAGALTSLSPSAWNGLLGPLQGLMPRSLAQADIGNKLHKGANAMTANSSSELYRLIVSLWSDPGAVVIDGPEPVTVLTDTESHPKTDGFVHEMMALDLLSYLPDDILCKVDRAAMGVSLETRVPLLDHRVVEFAWRLPLDYKLRDGVSKWVLREVLYRHVPRELIERPKMGFGIPIDEWLRGPLREWAEDLIGEQRLRQEGLFHPEPIRAKWAEHLTGRRNWAYQLWAVLMFQAWLADQ